MICAAKEMETVGVFARKQSPPFFSRYAAHSRCDAFFKENNHA